MATHALKLQPAPAADQRRAGRTAVTVSRATVREHGQEAAEARLVDLSIYGCRMAVTEEHADGDRVWLRFDGGWPIGATVVWATDDRIGCRFDEPIAGSLMRELTRALQ